jgi:TonB family protein
MQSENIDYTFKISLTVSVLVHAALFFPFFNIRFSKKQIFTPYPQISYVNFVNLRTDVLKQEAASRKDMPLPSDNKTVQQETVRKENVTKKSVAQENKMPVQSEKPALKAEDNYVKIQESVKKGQFEMVPEKQKTNQADSKEELAYQSYYKAIRELIRRSVKYPKRQVEGDVYVSFTLFNDGRIKRVSILDEESTDNSILKDAVLKGIDDPVPYPPFPDNLKKESLNLSVIISFKMRE